MRVSFNPTIQEVTSVLMKCGLSYEDIAAESLQDFIVKEGLEPVGVAGLGIFGSVALVGSVGVDAAYRSRGLGLNLLTAVEARAKEGVDQVYLLTNEAQRFFSKHGYMAIQRCSAPAGIQACSQSGLSYCGSATLLKKWLAV